MEIGSDPGIIFVELANQGSEADRFVGQITKSGRIHHKNVLLESRN